MNVVTPLQAAILKISPHDYTSDQRLSTVARFRIFQGCYSYKFYHGALVDETMGQTVEQGATERKHSWEGLIVGDGWETLDITFALKSQNEEIQLR